MRPPEEAPCDFCGLPCYDSEAHSSEPETFGIRPSIVPAFHSGQDDGLWNACGHCAFHIREQEWVSLAQCSVALRLMAGVGMVHAIKSVTTCVNVFMHGQDAIRN